MPWQWWYLYSLYEQSYIQNHSNVSRQCISEHCWWSSVKIESLSFFLFFFFSRWVRSHTAIFFLHYSGFFLSFVSHLILHCMKKKNHNIPNSPLVLRGKKKRKTDWSRKSGHACKHFVETRVQKVLVERKKMYFLFFFTYLQIVFFFFVQFSLRWSESWVEK